MCSSKARSPYAKVATAIRHQKSKIVAEKLLIGQRSTVTNKLCVAGGGKAFHWSVFNTGQ